VVYCFRLSTFHYSITPYINRFYQRLLFNRNVTVEDVSYKVNFIPFNIWQLKRRESHGFQFFVYNNEVFNFDCLFKQYVCEWCLPIEMAETAIKKMRHVVDNENSTHFPIEIRFSKGDNIWLSPCYGHSISCWIG
jgi:L-gulonolactone oxidase